VAEAQSTEAGLTTVVFDTAAAQGADGAWRIPLHAWTYRPQDSRVRKAAIAALFKTRYGLTIDEEARPLFDRRVNLLLADNARGKQPSVMVGGRSVLMPATSANGHTRLDVFLPASASASASVIEARAGAAMASVRAVGTEGISIICDIDDTVKDTGVHDRTALLRSTFYRPFKAVPGMVELLQRLGGPNPVVHFVSSSPWHLHAPLLEWLRAENCPVTSLHLKHIRLTDRSIFDLFGSPKTIKETAITGLFARFPRRQFVLVGDSGEADPVVYAAMARRFPTQVARILIRRAPGDARPPAEIAAAFSGLPAALAQVFEQPQEVA
jgi:hypothetical protein